jgi:hypothetical protein
MGDADRLAGLGLRVTDTGAGLEALLQLGTPLLNPLAGRPIATCLFALAEERLIPLEPPELVGLPPLLLDGVRARSELEQQLAEVFQTHLLTLQRQSSELRALGVTPEVSAETLELAARIEEPPFHFLIAGDKRGQLRVSEAAREGATSLVDVGNSFTLTEFPDRAALLAHLRDLMGIPGQATELAPSTAHAIEYRELLTRFGGVAWVPASAAIDVVVTIRVRGTPYRFAATRVGERTFRALLAGPTGKIWSDQFSLEAFPGVAAVVAAALNVNISEVELVGSWEEK